MKNINKSDYSESIFNKNITIESIKKSKITSFDNYFNSIKNKDENLLKDKHRIEEFYKLYLTKEDLIDVDWKGIKQTKIEKSNLIVIDIPIKYDKNYINIFHQYKYSKEAIFKIEKKSISFIYFEENELSIEEYKTKITKNLKKDIDYINQKLEEISEEIKEHIDSYCTPYIKKITIFDHLNEKFNAVKVHFKNNKTAWLISILSGLITGFVFY